MVKRCETDGCEKLSPTYNTLGETKGRFCAVHRKDGMVDVKHKRCETPGCEKQPTYNHQGETKGRFCGAHREDGMVNAMSKRCETPGCEKLSPTYNTQGETKGRFCAAHREDGMVDVMNKRCETPGCETRPTYNTQGETKARFCAAHRKDGMVDVKHKRCETPGCETRPSYNRPGKTKGRFCAAHREDGMVNMIDKRCETDGCETHPTYNTQGETKGRFCAAHRKDGMVNVKHKRCETPGCETLATFGLPGHPATRCKAHLVEHMTAHPRKRCSVSKCDAIAVWGVGKARHCEQHKEPTDLNLVERRCVSCGLLDILDPASKCGTCDPNEFNRRALAKQRRVKLYLDARGFVCNSYDVRVDNGVCGNERPDFVYESKSGGHVVVLEVDEDQHKGRPEQCECTRMVNVSQSLGLPTVFLRYNPDRFKTDNTRKDPAHSTRMTRLEQVLRYALALDPTELPGYCSVRRLFFDGWSPDAVEYDVVLAWHESGSGGEGK